MTTKEERIESVINQRMPHYHKDFPLILFWSQKSGCTTLLKWFYDQVGLIDEALQYHSWIHYYDTEKYKASYAYYLELIENLSNQKKQTVKLVRDPYKRTVSQFLILASNKGIPQWDQEWEKIREVFYGDRKSPQGITFKQYLHYLERVNDYDNHFMPQYVEGEEEVVTDYIKLETFHLDLPVIEKKFNLKPSNLALLSQSSHHLVQDMILDGNYADFEITEDTFSHGKKFPTYESFYDKESIDLVNRIFAKDFDMYGYKKR